MNEQDIISALNCLNQYLDKAQPHQKQRVSKLISLFTVKCGDADKAAILMGVALKDAISSSAVEGVSLESVLETFDRLVSS